MTPRDIVDAAMDRSLFTDANTRETCDLYTAGQAVLMAMDNTKKAERERSRVSAGKPAEKTKYEITATMRRTHLDPIELVRVEFWAQSFDEVMRLYELLGLSVWPDKIMVDILEKEEK